MKKLIAAALAVILSVSCLAMLSSCGDENKNLASGTGVVSGQSNTGGVDDPQTVSYEVVEPDALGDTLTAEIEGDWIVTSIYQTAKVSDQTESEALAKEQSKAIHIGSDFFESYSTRLEIPYYKVRTATQQEMQTEGFSITNIEKDFSGTINCVDVYEEDGTTLCCTFYIKGNNLVFMGTGAYIYLCTKTEAVG